MFNAGVASIGNRENFIADKMQRDDSRDVPFLEVTLHSISYIRLDRLERVALGEDRLSDGPGERTALGRFHHDRHDLDHGRVSANRPATKGMS